MFLQLGDFSHSVIRDLALSRWSFWMPSTNDRPALISDISILHRPYPDAQTSHNATENPFGLACPWARVEVRVYRNPVGHVSDPTL